MKPFQISGIALALLLFLVSCGNYSYVEYEQPSKAQAFIEKRENKYNDFNYFIHYRNSVYELTSAQSITLNDTVQLVGVVAPREIRHKEVLDTMHYDMVKRLRKNSRSYADQIHITLPADHMKFQTGDTLQINSVDPLKIYFHDKSKTRALVIGSAITGGLGFAVAAVIVNSIDGLNFSW